MQNTKKGSMIGVYKIYYYRSPSGDIPFEDFLDSLSEKQQVKVVRMMQYIKEYGLSAVLPHSKKLTGTALWEIRILGKDNIRIFYAVMVGNVVLVLSGFIKKSHKTPLKELAKAIARYEEWKKRNSN